MGAIPSSVNPTGLPFTERSQVRGAREMSKRIFLLSVLLGLAYLPASADKVIVINTPGSAPFVYQGYTYMPVQSVTKFLGADLGWDPNVGRAVINYKGQQFALTPGKANASFAGRSVVLASPPVVVNGRTYVSTEVFKEYYKVPMQWDKSTSQVRILGPNGWGTTTVRDRAPWGDGPPPWAPAWGKRAKSGATYWPGDNKRGKWSKPDKLDRDRTYEKREKSKVQDKYRGKDNYKGKDKGKDLGKNRY